MLHLILMSENVVSKWIDCELCWCEFHRKDIFNSVQESDSQKVGKQLVQIHSEQLRTSTETFWNVCDGKCLHNGNASSLLWEES